jgi:hypothetical protein
VERVEDLAMRGSLAHEGDVEEEEAEEVDLEKKKRRKSIFFFFRV